MALNAVLDCLDSMNHYQQTVIYASFAAREDIYIYIMYHRVLFIQEVMDDPVVIADGSSYERSAITRWFENDRSSPLTGMRVADTHLVPNQALRSVIALYQEHHGTGSEGGY